MAIPLDPSVLKSFQPDGLPSEVEIRAILNKYEKTKRDRVQAEGMHQFVPAAQLRTRASKNFVADPFVKLNQLSPTLDDLFSDRSCKFLIIGAGFGCLLMAAKLIDVGFSPEDLRMIDTAGSFGGAWYWNRYPGAMCDTESYIYLPLLEETGHVPKHRYSYAPELFQHARTIAERWRFADKACFYTTAKKLDWDDSTKKWHVVLEQTRPGETSREITVTSPYVYLNAGPLTVPQLPRLSGLDDFKGNFFHTSRWDYDLTGGEPGSAPDMHKLKDLNVAIVGTGASAIQCTPQLARCAKHLYVFQRTPSQVGARDQAPTDPLHFAEHVANGPGWQTTRARNFAAQHSLNPGRPADLINDGISSHQAWCGVAGGTKGVTQDNVVEYAHKLIAIDMVRANAIRERIENIVDDKDTAESLKFWSTGFCKRPTLHDDYLQAFNRPNVTLVDMNGASPDGLSVNGILFNGKEYAVDLIVFSTGFTSPVSNGNASKAGVAVTGRDGADMETKAMHKWATLHGCVSHGFPNLFYPGPSQGAFATCYTFLLDIYAQHVAHIIAESERRHGGARVVIEPAEGAEEAWAMRSVAQAPAFAGVAYCGPSYFNAYSDPAAPRSGEESLRLARTLPWAAGVLDFEEVLAEWRRRGGMEGLNITAA